MCYFDIKFFGIIFLGVVINFLNMQAENVSLNMHNKI